MGDWKIFTGKVGENSKYCNQPRILHSFIHAVITEYLPCAEEVRGQWASNMLSKMIQFQECKVSRGKKQTVEWDRRHLPLGAGSRYFNAVELLGWFCTSCQVREQALSSSSLASPVESHGGWGKSVCFISLTLLLIFPIPHSFNVIESNATPKKANLNNKSTLKSKNQFSFSHSEPKGMDTYGSWTLLY